MNAFTREGGILKAEGVSLADVAARFGTPVYVYSRAAIVAQVAALRGGLAQLPHRLCYAVKANGNLAILQILAAAGCDFDAGSAGELLRVREVGVAGERILFSGVGKRDDEIALALTTGVGTLAVESESELHAVARIAALRRSVATISIRVNPDVNAKTHPHIATGLKENKFGVPIADAPALYAAALRLPSLAPRGVSCHIGSQVLSVAPFRDAAERIANLAKQLMAQGVPLTFVGLGGGLGIRYDNEQPPSPAEYGAALAAALGPLGLTVVLEPGRMLVGNAGVLVSRVVRTKRGADRDFVVLDAGMNDLIRPALYGAHHHIEPVAQPSGAVQPVEVVGPVCESSDVFAHARPLSKLAEGDLVAIHSAGAYGFAMSSQYNGRLRPAEVLCDGTNAVLVRERETPSDLWRGEHRLNDRAP